MRLVTFSHPDFAITPRVGALYGDRVVDIQSLLAEPGPLELQTLLDDWPARSASVAAALERGAGGVAPGAGMSVPLAEATLQSPLPRPRGLRDFYAFEQHVATAYAKRGRDVPKAWYDIPVFYYCHPGSVYGPDVDVPMPRGTRKLDFELEYACVIGVGGRDIPAAEADAHIAGYTILNDWSARDIQQQEMGVGLGPAKGKDFATSLGPWLVTPDELADRTTDGRHDLTMIARVNGVELSRGNAKDLHWTFAQMVERASANVELVPGDVLGSGTVGTGCILELGEDVHRWLEVGDVVELEVELLGVLRNQIVG
jgi:fumarylacetoacetate (FAA) hydrolase